MQYSDEAKYNNTRIAPDLPRDLPCTHDATSKARAQRTSP